MTIITIDIDRTRDTIILSIDPAVMRIYETHAKTLNQDVTELLEGLLANWPAILAPANSSNRVWFVSDDQLLANISENYREGEYTPDMTQHVGEDWL